MNSYTKFPSNDFEIAIQIKKRTILVYTHNNDIEYICVVNKIYIEDDIFSFDTFSLYINNGNNYIIVNDDINAIKNWLSYNNYNHLTFMTKTNTFGVFIIN